jgi:DNA polymerase sigma
MTLESLTVSIEVYDYKQQVLLFQLLSTQTAQVYALFEISVSCQDSFEIFPCRFFYESMVFDFAA